MNDFAATQEVLNEILRRVRRIETRLCVLMEHTGMQQMEDGVFVDPADGEVLTYQQEIPK